MFAVYIQSVQPRVSSGMFPTNGGHPRVFQLGVNLYKPNPLSNVYFLQNGVVCCSLPLLEMRLNTMC